MATTTVAVANEVSASQLKAALELCFEVKQPVMIHGQPGIGKSQIIEGIAKERNTAAGKEVVKVYDIRLSQKEPTDLAGMPYFDSVTRRMMYAPPIDLPSAEEASQYETVIIFLDELTSALPNTAAAAYQLVLDGKVGTYTLPDNAVVVAAGNRAGDKGVVYRMPSPLANRMTHFDLTVNFEDWMEWALNNGIHGDIVGYLKFSPSKLNTFDPSRPEHAFATPRTWEFCSRILKKGCNPSTERNIIAGTVGEGVMVEFMAHRSLTSGLPDVMDILNGEVTEFVIDNLSAQFSIGINSVLALKPIYERAMAGEDESKKMAAYTMFDNIVGFLMGSTETEICVAIMRSAMVNSGIKIPAEVRGQCKNLVRFNQSDAAKMLVASIMKKQ